MLLPVVTCIFIIINTNNNDNNNNKYFIYTVKNRPAEYKKKTEGINLSAIIKYFNIKKKKKQQYIVKKRKDKYLQ